MKIAAALLATMFLAGPSIPYFKYQRPVQAQPGGQRYIAVDEQTGRMRGATWAICACTAAGRKCHMR